MMRRGALLCFGGFLAVYLILCTLTLRPELTGGDFALYILHARNIAEGVAYASTGFIHNPLNASSSPAAYPPGFPLLLAPVYALSGIDFAGFMHVITLATVALMIVAYALFRPVVGASTAAIVSAAAGLSPALFDRRDLIVSDIPCTFWCFLSLLLFERIRRARGPATWSIAALGCTVGMACATRTAGIALAGAIVLTCLARRPRFWIATLCVTLAGTLAVAVADRALHVDSTTYVDLLGDLRRQGVAGTLSGVIGAYGPGLIGTFGLSFGLAGNSVALVLILAAILAGWALRLRADAGAPEAFLPVYAAMLALFPVRDEPVRYLIPIAPLLFYYPAVAVRGLLSAARRPWLAPALVAPACAALFLPYYVRHDVLQPAGPSFTDPDSMAFYAAVRDGTGPNDVLLSSNPRVLVLMTRRRASIWPLNPTPEALRAYGRQVGATWVAERTSGGDGRDQPVHAVLAGADIADPVWKNRSYTLWRLRS